MSVCAWKCLCIWSYSLTCTEWLIIWWASKSTTPILLWPADVLNENQHPLETENKWPDISGQSEWGSSSFPLAGMIKFTSWIGRTSPVRHVIHTYRLFGKTEVNLLANTTSKLIHMREMSRCLLKTTGWFQIQSILSAACDSRGCRSTKVQSTKGRLIPVILKLLSELGRGIRWHEHTLFCEVIKQPDVFPLRNSLLAEFSVLTVQRDLIFYLVPLRRSTVHPITHGI